MSENSFFESLTKEKPTQEEPKKVNSFFESIKVDIQRSKQGQPGSTDPTVPTNHNNKKVHIGRSH